jgi:hypothetical protein
VLDTWTGAANAYGTVVGMGWVFVTDLAVLATLTGNGLVNPVMTAFDGQRVLVTNPTQ